jgi:hypothetical protein
MKLTPEEIAQRRQQAEQAAEVNSVLFAKIVEAKDQQARQLAIQEWEATELRMCEHGRHWSSHCGGCDEIDKQVFPERYKRCASCLELFEPEYIDAYDMCDECGDKLECLQKKSS